jgi:thiamine-monophosphate kinase
VVGAPDGRVVATTDLLVEGRHFRRDWSSAADVGVKAAAQNLADIAAMGATATALLVGLATPGDLPAQWALDLMRGLAAECGRAGAAIAGGDVTASDTLMLGVTALGDLGGVPPVTRAGARPGDILAVAGRLGWSAAGLALLSAGTPAADEDLARAHRRPQPPYAAGPQAARLGATSMIDISDGLIQDLGHVAAASGVSINIETARLPATGPLRAAAAALGTDWQDWALAGGEDHALVATFPPAAVLPAGWARLGTVAAGAGVLVDARPRGGPGGWNHFGGRPPELSAVTPPKSRFGVADLPPA